MDCKVIWTDPAIEDLGEIVRYIAADDPSEPLPSYLASKGITVTVPTFPPEDDRTKAWSATPSIPSHLEQAFHSYVVDRETFLEPERTVFHRQQPDSEDLTDYDFLLVDLCAGACWVG